MIYPYLIYDSSWMIHASLMYDGFMDDVSIADIYIYIYCMYIYIYIYIVCIYIYILYIYI